MRLAGALISLQERLPRFGGSGSGGPRPSEGALRVGLVSFGFLTLLSAVYITWHAGSTEALNRYPGLPAFSLSLTWVVLLASELLRRGNPERERTNRRLASAVLALVAWFVLIPALLLLGAVLLHTALGTTRVIGWAAFVVFVAGFGWTVGRYSGPVRRNSGH